jgi:hypothetical protein
MGERSEGVDAHVRGGSDQASDRMPAEHGDRRGGGHEQFHDQWGGARSVELTVSGQRNVGHEGERGAIDPFGQSSLSAGG